MRFEPCAYSAQSDRADRGSQPPPDARFTLERAPFAGQSFAVHFRVCPNPCCPCGVVGWVCQPETAPDQAAPPIQHAPPLCFDLDVCRRYLYVFSWADTIRFSRDGQEWFVDDQYCVRPGCDCTKAGLSFYREPAGTAPPDEPLRPVTFLHLDYRTGEFGLVEAQAGSPAAATLVSLLRAANPALADTLRHRHHQLKQLARRRMSQPPPKRPRSLPPSEETVLDDAVEEWLSQPPDPRVVRALARPGRNDPCPCGSGKKFKKCCGAA
jgi:hypothetical protein